MAISNMEHSSDKTIEARTQAPCRRAAEGAARRLLGVMQRPMVPYVMAPKFAPALSSDFWQTNPALGIPRMGSLLAEMEVEPDEEALNLKSEQVEAGFLTVAAPSEIWPELARGLMGPSPSKMLRILRACGALPQILPEVMALFGVPQICDEASDEDLGEHVLNTLAEAALCDAPLAARIALLVMNVGKADSPPEHLPVHYKHMDRGRPRIEALCDRFGAPAECRDLALLSLAECERVHRVSKVRAGPVALMLERLGAFGASGLFKQLMIVCACDYRAYAGRSGQVYPKAALLDIALEACAEVEAIALGDDASAVEARQIARAEAIARAFRSRRWSDELT
jgi:tRNA nucleotidyltransferase (CCA-adding enzyme)